MFLSPVEVIEFLSVVLTPPVDILEFLTASSPLIWVYLSATLLSLLVIFELLLLEPAVDLLRSLLPDVFLSP